MQDNTASRRRRGLVVPLALAAVATTGLTALFSGAFFTDSATVTGNTFTTGTVDISATPATAAVSLSNMAPGDTVVAPLTVQNTGSLQERYALTSVATNADGKGLAGALQMTIKSGVTTCTAGGFAADGTAVSGPTALGTVGGLAVFGDPAQGAQSGDRVLAAGASEVLCVKVTLPTTAGNPLQDATTSATFTFDSEQTANN